MTQTLPDRGRRLLVVALLAYAVLALALSICQAGYVNADFIGYATLAHRLLSGPRTSVSGAWSPLFSWCLVPLIAMGAPDLIAGRVIELVAGAIYIVAYYTIARRFLAGRAVSHFPAMVAIMACAVVHAVVAATAMLDPDLLAAALIFIYFSAILDPALPRKPGRAFLAGLVAGLSYLAKAFMFPFVVIHLPVSLWLLRRRQQMEEKEVALHASDIVDPSRSPLSISPEGCDSNSRGQVRQGGRRPRLVSKGLSRLKALHFFGASSATPSASKKEEKNNEPADRGRRRTLPPAIGVPALPADDNVTPKPTTIGVPAFRAEEGATSKPTTPSYDVTAAPLGLKKIGTSESNQTRWPRSAASFILFLAAFILVSAPWIAVLSAKYHHLTFSTAGASNHANISPENEGKDLLWHPGLAPDFIADPHFGPDWSPFQDRRHFVHQVRIIVSNFGIGIDHLLPWLLLLALASVVWWVARLRGKSSPLTADERLGVQWCLLTALIYCGGYTPIMVQWRYIAPVAGPLLCLAALLMLSALPAPDAPPRRWFSCARLLPPRSAWAALILIAPFLLRDVWRFRHIALKHAQNAPLAKGQLIARRLEAAGAWPGPLASSQFHDGLLVAYAADHVSTYLGTPRATAPDAMTAELNAAGARCYLLWIDPTSINFQPLAPQSPWRRIFTIADPAIGASKIEVYLAPPNASPPRSAPTAAIPSP